MFAEYEEKQALSRPRADGFSQSFSRAVVRFLLAGVVILSTMLFPLEADCGQNFSNPKRPAVKHAKSSVVKKTSSVRAARDNDAISSVLAHLRTYRKAVRNKRYVTIIDYSKPSNVKRMYLIDIKTGRVEKYLVSHGKRSGWAYATTFSNRPESFQSCRGFFVTGRKYCGKHGIALQLHGLDKGVNDNALRRGIVIHGANYVSSRSVMLNGGRLGRSLGCPAIPADVAEPVIDRIKGGSLVYIHGAGKACASEGSKRAVKHRG